MCKKADRNRLCKIRFNFYMVHRPQAANDGVLSRTMQPKPTKPPGHAYVLQTSDDFPTLAYSAYLPKRSHHSNISAIRPKRPIPGASFAILTKRLRFHSPCISPDGLPASKPKRPACTSIQLSAEHWQTAKSRHFRHIAHINGSSD